MFYKHFSFIVFQEGSPFIVCMTYAFQTLEKLCFILDLMNSDEGHVCFINISHFMCFRKGVLS